MKRNQILATMLAFTMAVTGAAGSLAAVRPSATQPALAAGSDFALAIDRYDDVWAWGNNDNGQLTDLVSAMKTASASKVFENAAAIAAGKDHILLVDSMGELYSTGSNGYYQLGHTGKINAGTLINLSEKYSTLSSVIDVACGDDHSLALTDNGYLYAWGRNDYGQLGNNSTTKRYTPVRIMTGVEAIAADGNVSMALKTNGDLYVWGQNNLYQVGNGKTTTQKTPVRVLQKVKAFDTGGRHCLAVTTNGYLYGWGYGAQGQMGNGKKYSISKPTRINAGTLTSSGRTETSTLGRVQDVKCGNYSSMILLETGRAYASGLYRYTKSSSGTLQRYSQSRPLLIGTGIRQIECGDEFFIMTNANGSIYARGVNEYGQLGNGKSDRLPSNTAYKIGFTGGSTPTPSPTPTQTPTGPYNGARLLNRYEETKKGRDGVNYLVSSRTYEGKAANGNPFQVVEVSYTSKFALSQLIGFDEGFAFTAVARLDDNGNAVPWEGSVYLSADQTKLLYVRGTIDVSLLIQLGTKVVDGRAVHEILGTKEDNEGGGQVYTHATYGLVKVVRSKDTKVTGSDGASYTYHITEYLQQGSTSGTPFTITETEYPSKAAIRALIPLNGTFDAPSRYFYLDDGTRLNSNVSYYLKGTTLIRTENVTSTAILKSLGDKVTTPKEVYEKLGIPVIVVDEVINHAILGSVKVSSQQMKTELGSDNKYHTYSVTTYVQQTNYGTPFTVVEYDYGTKEDMRALVSSSKSYSFRTGPITMSDGKTQNFRDAAYVNGEKLYETDYLTNLTIVGKLGTRIYSGADIYRIQNWPAGQVGETITHSVFGQVKVVDVQTKSIKVSATQSYNVLVSTYEKQNDALEKCTIVETVFPSSSVMKSAIAFASDFARNSTQMRLSNGDYHESTTAYYVSGLTLYETTYLRDYNIIVSLGKEVKTATEATAAVN